MAPQTLADRAATAPWGGDPARLLHDTLRAVVLLGGSVRLTPFAKAVGRSLLDLPLTAEQTLLQRWVADSRALADGISRPELELRVLLSKGVQPPTSSQGGPGIRLNVVEDASEYQGTGGALRDLARGLEPTDRVLVVTGQQVLTESLSDQVHALASAGGDLSLVAHQDGTPVGVILASAQVLAGIRETAFSDFKEQALPELAQRFDIRVVTRPRGTGISVRTLEGYLDGLHFVHRANERTAPGGGIGEDWSPTFRIVEPGAHVDAGTHVHDSVVLRGGAVRRGGVAVRSVVCSGAVVDGSSVVDEVIGPAGRRPRGGAS